MDHYGENICYRNLPIYLHTQTHSLVFLVSIARYHVTLLPCTVGWIGCMHSFPSCTRIGFPATSASLCAIFLSVGVAPRFSTYGGFPWGLSVDAPPDSHTNRSFVRSLAIRMPSALDRRGRRKNYFLETDDGAPCRSLSARRENKHFRFLI